jgi:hypothetical protein
MLQAAGVFYLKRTEGQVLKVSENYQSPVQCELITVEYCHFIFECVRQLSFVSLHTIIAVVCHLLLYI